MTIYRPIYRKVYNTKKEYPDMAKRLDVHDIREFDQSGIRKTPNNNYQLKEGIIRYGFKDRDIYLERTKWLYIEENVDRIILISPKDDKTKLEKLAGEILEKCNNEWKRSPGEWLIRECKFTFKGNIEIIDDEKKEEKIVIIVQINLVSNLYSTAEYYLSQINENPDMLSKVLVRILAGLYPKKWKKKLPEDIPHYNPKDVLEILKLITPETALMNYFEFFYAFFAEEDWDIDKILSELETLLETSTSFHKGLTDLHLVLRVIHRSLSLDSFSEITGLKNEIDNYLQTIPDPERYTDMLYRKFHEISVLLEKFRDESDFQDKLYFLEQSRRKIKEAEDLVRDKFVEPFKKFYSDALDKWMNIVREEGDSLSGRAALRAELQTKRATWREKILVSLNIRSVGTGSAKNIKVSLNDSDEYEIFDQNFHCIDNLQRNRDEDVDFYIKPLKRDSINLSFSISYGEEDIIEITGVLFFVQQEEFSRISNPYNFTKPAENDMFFDRDDLFKWIEENMKGSSIYQNVLIEGQRRTGKTSFLKQLHKRISSDHYCIFIDLELYQDTGDIMLLREICEELKHSISTDIPLPSLQEFVNKRYVAFNNYIKNIHPNNPKKIILIFDEFDKITSNIENGLFKPGFLLSLRGFLQHNTRINAIISGRFDFNKLDSSEWREFFTIFNPRKIGALDEDSAKALITQPVEDSLQYDQYSIKKILDFSGRNPFYIQLLCHTLVNYINEKKRQSFVEAEDIGTVVLNEAKEKAEPILRFTWDDLDQVEKNTLFALSRLENTHGRSISLAEIQEFLRNYNIIIRRGKLLKILESLIEKDVVMKYGEYPPFYNFNVVLLRNWIAEHGQIYG